MVLKINPRSTESPSRLIGRESPNGMWSSTYIPGSALWNSYDGEWCYVSDQGNHNLSRCQGVWLPCSAVPE